MDTASEVTIVIITTDLIAALKTNILHLYRGGSQKTGAGQVSHATLTKSLTRPEEFDCRVRHKVSLSSRHRLLGKGPEITPRKEPP